MEYGIVNTILDQLNPSNCIDLFIYMATIYVILTFEFIKLAFLN
jgi:hypothetical protein